MSWFKRTPDQELVADARYKADEFNRALGKLKRAGLSVTVWGRNYGGRQIIHVIDEVEVEQVNRKKF